MPAAYNSIGGGTLPSLIEDGSVEPDLARTFLPGRSAVPVADLDMFLTCKFSMKTTAWFLLIAVEALCRKSRRVLPMRI